MHPSSASAFLLESERRPAPPSPFFNARKLFFIIIVLLSMILIVAVCILAVLLRRSVGGSHNLKHFYMNTLRTKKFVDLTHSFDETIPHWKGVPAMNRTLLYWYEEGYEGKTAPGANGYSGYGFFIEQFCHVGQWGTHIDPPAHFVKNRKTLDEIEVSEMVLPLVVIDVHEQVALNPDYTLTMDDIRAWEAKYGQIVEGSFVAMRTDWSKRWPNEALMENRACVGGTYAECPARYPGWSKETLQFLYETRGITASGHETTDTDPGSATSRDDYSLETYILDLNHYQIELMNNLDQVPQDGALIVIGAPKVKGGSGFPARVFAILP